MTDYMVIVNESNHMPPDFISTVELIDYILNKISFQDFCAKEETKWKLKSIFLP